MRVVKKLVVYALGACIVAGWLYDTVRRNEIHATALDRAKPGETAIGDIGYDPWHGNGETNELVFHGTVQGEFDAHTGDRVMDVTFTTGLLDDATAKRLVADCRVQQQYGRVPCHGVFQVVDYHPVRWGDAYFRIAKIKAVEQFEREQ
jgi:hypothetical protein